MNVIISGKKKPKQKHEYQFQGLGGQWNRRIIHTFVDRTCIRGISNNERKLLFHFVVSSERKWCIFKQLHKISLPMIGAWNLRCSARSSSISLLNRMAFNVCIPSICCGCLWSVADGKANNGPPLMANDTSRQTCGALEKLKQTISELVLDVGHPIPSVFSWQIIPFRSYDLPIFNCVQMRRHHSSQWSKMSIRRYFMADCWQRDKVRRNGKISRSQK